MSVEDRQEERRTHAGDPAAAALSLGGIARVVGTYTKARASGDEATCVEIAPVWLKPRASTDSANCLEVAQTPEGIAVRNSRDPEGPVVYYDAGEIWAALIGFAEGDFDELLPSCPLEFRDRAIAAGLAV